MSGQFRAERTYAIGSIAFLLCSMIILYTFITNYKWDSIVWLILLICSASGVLVSVLPDMLINLEICNIEIQYVRIDLLLKLAIFVLINEILCQGNQFIIAPILAVLGILAIFTTSVIYQKLKAFRICAGDIIGALRKLEGRNAELLLKYVVFNIFNIALFMNMQDSKTECLVFGVLCIGIHFFTCKKMLEIIENNRNIKKIRYGLGFWGLHLINMFFCIKSYQILSYTTSAIYTMIVIDLAMNNKTAIIKNRE